MHPIGEVTDSALTLVLVGHDLGRVVTVTAHGELDFSSRPTLEAALHRVLEGRTSRLAALEIDLRQLCFVDVSSLQQLRSWQARLAPLGVALQLRLTSRQQRLLDRCPVDAGC